MPAARREPVRDQRAGGGTDLIAEHDEPDHGGLPALGRIFGGERDGVRQHPADAEPGRESIVEQLLERRGHHGGEADHAEQERAQHHDALAAEPVTEHAEDGSPDHQAAEAGAEHGPERAALQMPGANEKGRGVAHDERVVAVRHHGGEQQTAEHDLEAPDPLPLDHLENVDCFGADRVTLGHARLPFVGREHSGKQSKPTTGRR
jgi:hypothetical protein